MILDRQAALERIEHDHELYDEICGIFRDDAPEILIKMSESFMSGNILLATRYAHSLRSAAANIGAVDLSETAKSAEIAFRAEDLETISDLITKIDQNLTHVLEELG
ncbi:MAG: Hpt domain-containing protein [Geobacteraceae bacterium]|nr:Hpt domain-containing protein [Geobacteraceae bacterium]